MKTLVLFAQKGGSGKTTLALHLAVAAIQAGQRVAVLDLDPQRSAAMWATARQKALLPSEPRVIPLPVNDLPRALAGAKNDGFDLVVIDAPPHASAAAASIVEVADLILIPVRPSPIDLAAVPATLAIVGSKPSAFVLSACTPRVPETTEMQAVLKGMGRPVLGPIHQRIALARSFTAGQAVIEFEPHGPAAQEINQLFAAVKGML